MGVQMIFRSESDIVYASNASQSLANLVRAYLELYRKYANGLNGINIPSKNYAVVFQPMRKEGYLNVGLVYTRTDMHQSPVYYDVDDDEFDESWGADNVSHYTTSTTDTIIEQHILIPFGHLLCNQEKMEQSIKEFAERKEKELQEEQRRSKIRALEVELERLKVDK